MADKQATKKVYRVKNPNGIEPGIRILATPTREYFEGDLFDEVVSEVNRWLVDDGYLEEVSADG